MHENGTPDVDKLIYGLIYLCGLVTFCLPHPEYNDIVPTNVQRPFSWLSSLILPHLSRLLSLMRIHLHRMDRSKSYYVCISHVDGVAVPYRNVLHTYA